ncbi:flavin reductase family protein [Hahella sp. SMD15-11]|uniref:Flavin reductase family protein n=1 Tax=Thermohahella caldifontis TaxID=3142973 RepID=A0AB39UXB0_9GAMM
MIIDFARLKPLERYHWVTQTLIPRPIAWVLTENLSGQYNLAPFSYFTAVSSAPPVVMISIGKKPDGSPKDTAVHAKRTGRLVIHVAGYAQLDALNLSSETLPEAVSEVEKLGIELTAFEGFALPRVADAPVAYGCRVHSIQELGDVPQTLLFAEIEQVYVRDDAVIEETPGRYKVNARVLDPLARLGAREYATLGEVVERERPA